DHTNSTLFVYGTGELRQLRADNKEGRIFIELEGVTTDSTGSIPWYGFEIVDVAADPTPVDVNVELGTRVPAYEDRRDDSQLQVFPPTASTRFFYAQRIPNSTKSILYATAETFNATDFQAYWLVTGVAGLQWPFIFNRYHEYWPSDPGEYINYVRPLVT